LRARGRWGCGQREPVVEVEGAEVVQRRGERARLAEVRDVFLDPVLLIGRAASAATARRQATLVLVRLLAGIAGSAGPP